MWCLCCEAVGTVLDIGQFDYGTIARLPVGSGTSSR